MDGTLRKIRLYDTNYGNFVLNRGNDEDLGSDGRST